MGLKVYIGFVSFNGQKNMGSILHITLSVFLSAIGEVMWDAFTEYFAVAVDCRVL